MIRVTIGENICFPSDKEEIKVNFENPYVKKGDTRTMEISFPLHIEANLKVFGSINRLDTHFESEVFEDCALLADNMEVIRGTGVITSVTRDEVKLQITSGKSSSKYEESWSEIFIDNIDYGDISSQHEFLRKMSGTISEIVRDSEYQSQGFIGVPGKYAFLPVYDETNDLFYNAVAHVYDSSDYRGLSISSNRCIMPNLIYVLTKVMDRIGFSVAENVYNTSPWNNLYICKVKQKNLNMSAALPHWTVSTFLEEFRKTFNAIFLFDHKTHQVRIRNFNQVTSLERVKYEALDEFSSGFEEQGVEYLGSSNLEYDLSTCERLPDCISQEMINTFGMLEYDSYNELLTAFNAMTTKQKLTKLFKCPNGFYYGYVTLNDEGVITDVTLEHCGENTPLVRKVGGSSVTLKMVPVAIARSEFYSCAGYYTNWMNADTGEYYWGIATFNRYVFEGLAPVVQAEPLQEESDELNTDYTTVWDVFNRGESIPSMEEEDVQMELVFASGIRVEHACERAPEHAGTIDFNRTTVPESFTDRWQDPPTNLPAWSLSLNVFTDRTCVGSFHNGGYKIVQQVNGCNEIQIDFICDGKPDPENIFVFHNRLYLCSYIEASVRDGSMDRVKRGHFFEIKG